MKLDQANTPTHVVILLQEHFHANAFEHTLQLTGPHVHHKLQSEHIWKSWTHISITNQCTKKKAQKHTYPFTLVNFVELLGVVRISAWIQHVICVVEKLLTVSSQYLFWQWKLVFEWIGFKGSMCDLVINNFYKLTWRGY